MLTVLTLLAAPALAEDLAMEKIVLSGGGADYDIMRNINDAVGEACAWSEEDGKAAFDAADANDDGKLAASEYTAMSTQLNKRRRKGCQTIKLVTDG